MKVTFTMAEPEEKKHSVRFNFEALDTIPITGILGIEPEDAKKALKNASFYIPKPIGEHAKRIRVTIEEL
jgi:hypothetical protein